MQEINITEVGDGLNNKTDFICEITKEMDKHLAEVSKNKYFITYLYSNNLASEQKGIAIRYPGATRGHVEFDSNKVITDIVLYSTAIGGCVACYMPSVKDATKKFIGSKLIFPCKEAQP